MIRKKYTRIDNPTPENLVFREKKKWQIALRRYVIEKSPCTAYAPYFGMDIKNMRQWFECQFSEGMNWGNFGSLWQFNHIIPLVWFDFSMEEELLLCWNFTNIRVVSIHSNKERGQSVDILFSKQYFEALFKATGFAICKKQIEKIKKLELSEAISTDAQRKFINDNKEYLSQVENYSSFEFELLNSGRTVAEVLKEVSLLKNIGARKQ